MPSPPPSTSDPYSTPFSLPSDTDPGQIRPASPTNHNSYVEETPDELPQSIKQDGRLCEPPPANIIEGDYTESQWPSVLFVSSDSQPGERSPLSLGDSAPSPQEQPSIGNKQRLISVWTEEKRWLLEKVRPKFVPMLLGKCGNEAPTEARINSWIYLCPRHEKE